MRRRRPRSGVGAPPMIGQRIARLPAEQLPANIVVHDLGVSANIPEVARLKYVRTSQGVLLVEPSNRIVVGEIAN